LQCAVGVGRRRRRLRRATRTTGTVKASSSTPAASLHALASLHFSLCWLSGVAALLAVCGGRRTTTSTAQRQPAVFVIMVLMVTKSFRGRAWFALLEPTLSCCTPEMVVHSVDRDDSSFSPLSSESTWLRPKSSGHTEERKPSMRLSSRRPWHSRRRMRHQWQRRSTCFLHRS